MLGRCSLRFTRALYIYVIFHQAWPRKFFWPREINKENLDRRDRFLLPSRVRKRKKSCLLNDVAIFNVYHYIFFIPFFFFLRRIASYFSYFFFFLFLNFLVSCEIVVNVCRDETLYELYRMSFTNHVRTLQKVIHNTHARQSRMCTVTHT